MIKKIITGVATVGLSLTIVSTAGAEELSRPTSPIQGNTIIETTSIITPYNLTKSYSTNRYYNKSDYPNNTALPTKISYTENAANGVWVGTLTLVEVIPYSNGWNCIYSGTLTLY